MQKSHLTLKGHMAKRLALVVSTNLLSVMEAAALALALASEQKEAGTEGLRGAKVIDA